MGDAGSDTMGNLEADHASPMGATANMPMAGHVTEERARQNTPLWMETSTTLPEPRRGAAPPPRSGLHTFLFFALIVFVVGAAGIGGVALWGPEKTIKNRTQFATNPPPPTPLPSLPAAASSATALPVVAEVVPPAVESARPAEAAPAKKGKRTPRAAGKKAR